MSTAKQVKANRNNARKSTGPRTEAGKETSSRNAVRHGLTAEHHFVDGEDQGAFEQLRTALADQMEPVTVMELLLLDRLAATLWRLRRVPAIEAAVIEALAHPRSPAPHDTSASGNVRKKRGRPPLSAPPHSGHPLSLTVGQAFEIALSNNILEKISRYDTALMTQWVRTEEALRQLIFVRQQQMLADATARKPMEAPMSAEEGWKRIKLA